MTWAATSEDIPEDSSSTARVIAKQEEVRVLLVGDSTVANYPLERIERGEIDPSFVITHRMRLEDAPTGFDLFVNKQDDCMKVVLSA